MVVGSVVQLASVILMAAVVCAVLLIAGLLLSRRWHGVAEKASAMADAARSAIYEMQLIDVVETHPTELEIGVDIDTEEDLADATCRVCGSACQEGGGEHAHPGGADADPRLDGRPVRGEIFVTAADVGFRGVDASSNTAAAADDAATNAAAADDDDDDEDDDGGGASSFFFYRGGGQQPMPPMLERIRPAGGRRRRGHQFACIAALPGHDYHAWHCPDRHPAKSRLCPSCRPLVSFRLRPGELLFHPDGGGRGNVWVAASVEEPATTAGAASAAALESGQRRLVAYRGPLSGLKRLPYRGAGKLTILFGADAADADVADAAAAAAAERDLCDRAGVSSQFSCSRDEADSEFRFTLQGGLAAPLSQISASNQFPQSDDADLSDCDASSSTMSAQTDMSSAALAPRKAPSSAKWAAIGMQEVAGVIESSSPEEQQSAEAEAAAVAAAAMQSQNSASASNDTDDITTGGCTDDADAATATAAGAAAARAAAAAAAIAAASGFERSGGAATDTEYLKFMYSDGSSSDGVDCGGESDNGAAGPSRSTEFYSAESNATSLAGSTEGGISAIESGQSD